MDQESRQWAVKTVMKYKGPRGGFWFPDPFWPERQLLIGQDREQGVVIYQLLPPGAFEGTEAECRTPQERFGFVCGAEHPEDPMIVVLARWYSSARDFARATERVREAARTLLEGGDRE